MKNTLKLNPFLKCFELFSIKVLIGGLIDLSMFLPLILLAFLFRKTRRFHTKYDRLKKTMQSFKIKTVQNKALKINSKSERFAFPWFFKVVLYAISFLCMIVSIFFTILKGLKK